MASLNAFEPIFLGTSQVVNHRIRKGSSHRICPWRMRQSSFKGQSIPPIRLRDLTNSRPYKKAFSSGEITAGFTEDFLHNQIIWTTTFSCVFTQCLKPFSSALAGRGLNWKLVIKSGGMPSSHTASVTALATAVGLQRGASDSLFGVCVIYACIVMYDAQGVRRAVGKQAEVMNTLVVPKLAPRGSQPTPLSGKAALPPSGAIGVELARSLAQAEIAFMSNIGLTPTSADVSRISSPPIGAELALDPVGAELAFMESRSSNGTSRMEGAGPSNLGLGGDNRGQERDKSQGPSTQLDHPSSPVAVGTEEPHSVEPGKWDSVSSLSGNVEIDGIDSPDSAVASVLAKASSTLKWARSKSFWAAASANPSFQEGQVEEQELGQLDGWRHLPLKESVGHTKTEVVVGAASGIIFALILDQLGWFSSLG